MSDKKDRFFKSVDSFFKRVKNQDLIKISGNQITSFNAPASKEEMKRKAEFSVFRQFLQQKNWSTKHKELFSEYRKMDETFPIINAALRLYSQEICVVGTTVIRTPAGDFTIKELYDKGKNKDFFYVQSYNNTHSMTEWNMVKFIKSNGKKKVIEIEVERKIDAETALLDTIEKATFKCTGNHKIMINSKGEFKEAKDLKEGETIFGLYKWIDPECRCKRDKFTLTKVLSIKDAGEEEVFDLVDVQPNKHFSIKLTDTFFVEAHNCTKDTDGNVIKIITDNKAVQEALEECFFDNLKMNSQSYLLAKEMIKFGNLYCFLNTRRGVGVTDLIHLPPEAVKIQLLPDAESLDSFIYDWVGFTGAKFEPWELVHWKNIEDIELMPYGSSILRSVVDTYRRIILMREALIIYRITRAPQRYLFKIDTSGMDPDTALRFAAEMKKSLYKQSLVNPTTGEIDFRYNPLPISGKTPIPLLNGEVKTIAELAKEYDEGKTNYVYSIKDDTHEVVAGEVKWCGKNYTANKLIRVWLDNDSYIDSAPEHPFMRRDGGRVRADELEEGDSLMPLYLGEEILFKSLKKKSTTYTTIYNPATEKHEFVHRLIAKEPNNSVFEYYNLKRKKKICAVCGEVIIDRKDKKIVCNRECYKKLRSLKYRGDKIYNYKGGGYKKNCVQCGKLFETKNKNTKSCSRICLNKYSERLETVLQERGEYDNSPSVYLNHKVKKIEILENISEDVYCMTVVGLENEEDRHNFACLALEINNEITTISSSGSIIYNSVEENYYVPTFEGDNSSIEVLQGASNLNDVEDYKIIKDDLFAGLLIPKSYLSFEEDLCIRYNTNILTNEGIKEIGELSKIFEETPDKKMFALSCNKYGIVSSGKILWCKPTKKVTELYKIYVNDSSYVECTDNHPFLMSDLSYVNADKLRKGDKLKGIYEHSEFIVSNIEIVKLEEEESVYDLEVDEYHNFALENGIFVHNSNKAALSQEDLRFSGAIKQYQSYFIEGLLHIACVHLHLNGFSQEDMESFTIEMNTNSTLAEKTRNELLQQRIDLAKSALDDSNGMAVMSYTYVLKEILKFTDEEIARTFKDQLIEKKIMWRLNELKTNGFYDEPEQEKKRALMKGLNSDENVFKDLKFEAATPEIKNILTEKLEKELSQLLRPVRAKATKKMIKNIIENNNFNKNANDFEHLLKKNL